MPEILDSGPVIAYPAGAFCALKEAGKDPDRMMSAMDLDVGVARMAWLMLVMN
jgi:hypothetical protein